MEHRRVTFFRWLNGLAFVMMVALNAAANTLTPGGVKTGEVSEKYWNLFTPAPLTFSIWGLIYLLLAGFAFYQAGLLDHGSARSERLVLRVGWRFALGCALNMAWLLCWHFDQIGWSVLLMFSLLASLISVRYAAREQSDTWREKLFVRAAFGLYYGWILVASLSNVSAWLVKLRWDGWGLSPQAWTVIVLAVGALLAGAVFLKERDPACLLGVVWGYAGIVFRHCSPSGLALAYPAVIVAASLGGAALLFLPVWAALQTKRP